MTASDSGVAPVWTDDSRHVIYVEADRLMHLDLVSEEKRELYAPYPYQVNSRTAVSVDSRWIYFSVVATEGDVWMQRLED